MALSRVNFSFNCLRLCGCNFSSSSVLDMWRKSPGTKPHPKKFELLSRLPDYSFTDGRPTPLSFRQQLKLLKQEKYCKKIVELSHELDVGLENYYKKQEEIEKYRETVLKNKLKPKGKALLNKNTVKS